MHRTFGRDNWLNPGMQTTLLNTYLPTLIATILKALREQLKESDQLNAVEEIESPVPEVPLLTKSTYGTQDALHICQLDYANLISEELGGFRRGKHSAALFHNPSQDVRMAVHGDDCLCLSGDDGLQHIDSLFKSKYRAKDMGTLEFEDSDVKSLLLLNHVFRVGVDQTGQYLDIEPDLRHAPLTISGSGCKTITEAVGTHHERNYRTNLCFSEDGVRF